MESSEPLSTKEVPAPKNAGRYSSITLDPALYNPNPEQIAFFKQQTGIGSDEELREHILAVQKEAWDVVHYMCIRVFGFLKLTISRHKSYPDILKLGKERPGAIFLEFACCFGNDARKVIADGYPMENVVTSDLEKPFFDLGHKLFRTTPQSYPLVFVPGDVFDPLLIAPHEPFYEMPPTARPDLSTLTSLTPLHGHISAIHAAQFFHLFSEEGQVQAARALAALLSPLPGSMIFGVHMSKSTTGSMAMKNLRGRDIYCYAPEDWKALWDGVIFRKGTVVVEVNVIQIDDTILPPESFQGGEKESQGYESVLHPMDMMTWSVKRL